ncbi:MAG: SH3 domain-containing protein [Coriobacteriia bacterium]|nr:SH3 domain-containing protein [Coriobacteriia bacterium]
MTKTLGKVGRLLTAGLLAISLAGVTHALVPAQSFAVDIIAPVRAYYKDIVITAEQPFYLRANASSKAAELKNSIEVKQGDYIHAEGISNDGNWVYIRYQQQVGWIPKSSFKEVTPVQEAGFAQEDAPIYQFTDASTEVGNVPKGTQIQFDADSGDGFKHTVFQGASGWVKAEQFGAEAPKEEPEPQEQETVEVTTPPVVEETQVAPAPVVEQKTMLEVALGNPRLLILAAGGLVLMIIAIAAAAIASRR